MFGRSNRATAIRTALFLLLLPSHNEGTTTGAVTQKASSTLRTVLHPINDEHAEFGKDYVSSTQPLSTANPRIPEQTAGRSSQSVSTIVAIDVPAPTTEIPSSSASTSVTDNRHHPDYIKSKNEIQDEVKTGNFQEIDEAVTQTETHSLRSDTDVNIDAKKNGDKNLGAKNANALEEEVEDGHFGPKNEVEIVPFSRTTSQTTLLKISNSNETKVVPKETTQKPLTTETTTPKPYPYTKQMTSTSERVKEVSTEETSAFENTIGRHKPEEKLSVTDPSYEKSLPKLNLKPTHPKRSDPTASTESSTSSSLETNDVTLNVTVQKQSDESLKSSPSGLTSDTNLETSHAEPSTEKLSTVTLPTPVSVASTEVLTRDRSHTTSLADVNTSDDKLALESFDRVNLTTPKVVEYEIVKLSDSTSKDLPTEHTESNQSEQESTSLKTTTDEFTSPTAAEIEEVTTTSTTNTLDGDSTEASTDNPPEVTTEPMTPTDGLPISGKHPDNGSVVHTTVAMQENTELPTLQNTNILTTSGPTTTTTEEVRIAEVPTKQIKILTSIGPAAVVPNLPRVKIDIEAPLSKVCDNLHILRKYLADLLSSDDMNFSAERVMLDTSQCSESARLPADVTLTTVLVYVVDENGNLDESLTEMLYDMLYKQNPNASSTLPIRSFILVTLPKADSGNAIAVVAVSCVAFICLALLAGLLFIMRKRQTRFNYGERCRPVSLDAYSLDSVSAYNSVRRKGAPRSSKRSYGNPTFEDASAIPSHPLNFAGLSSFCEDHNSIGEEYAGIPQVTAKMDELPAGAEVKNRYANVVPLPETRVTLSRLNNDPLTEYINASYVRGPKNAMKYYIACQAPTEATVVDFWRMIWEQQSKVIIMLTDLVENGVEKCTEYIPPSEVTDCKRLFGDYQITLKKRETKEKYAISTLVLKNVETNTYREVHHIWYLWPASGVPSDAAAVIAIILEARALQRGGPEPIVVHCSPGTGRTGTLISLDLGIRQYEITRTVDVPRVVYTIRRDRAGAVQTKEQYSFIYKALNLYAMKLAGGALEST